MNIEDFWKPFEKEISSFEEAMNTIHELFRINQGKKFAWRGQVNAAWPLHSSLYRRIFSLPKKAPDEGDLQNAEKKVLQEVHEWGLHAGDHGRLSVLSQLAVLQHYGAPTRLIDITFNPLIGLWFAVEDQKGSEKWDGRLFAVDVTNRLINEDREKRLWEDALAPPWPKPKTKEFNEWTTTAYAWRPARLDHRIAAQNGGFLIGGVPSSSNKQGPQQWPKGPKVGTKWKIGEVRQAVSVSLRVHKLEPSAGALPTKPVYTLRIKQTAKEEIRTRLQNLYGYSHRTIYPDYPGFASYLKSPLTEDKFYQMDAPKSRGKKT